MNILPISLARAKLPELVEDAATLAKTTYITVKGKVKAAVVDAQKLERMEATIDILSDPAAMKAIKKGEKDVKTGRLIDWEDIKNELNL